MPHDKLAGIRQATFDGAMMSHDRERLGITEEELRAVIWGAKNEVELANDLQALRQRAGERMRNAYRTVQDDAGAGVGAPTEKRD